MASFNVKSQTPQEAYNARKIKMALSGMKIALLLPISAIIQNIFNSSVTDTVSGQLSDKVIVSIMISIVLLGIGDIFAGIFTFIYNVVKGKGLKEYKENSIYEGFMDDASGSSVCRTACHRLLDGGDAVLRTDDGSDRDQPGSDPDSNIRTFFPSRKAECTYLSWHYHRNCGRDRCRIFGGIGCGEQLYTRYHPGIHGTH